MEKVLEREEDNASIAENIKQRERFTKINE